MDLIRELNEPVAILPVYCDGLARIVTIEGMMRFTFCVTQQAADGGAIERVVALRVIMPTDGVAAALPAIIGEVARAAVGGVRDSTWQVFRHCRAH